MNEIQGEPHECLACGATGVRSFTRYRGGTLRCTACGFVFRSSIPSAEDLHEIYRSDSYFKLGLDRGIGYADYFADEALYRPYFACKVRALGRFSAPGDLFEVGSAAGFFLDEARAAGWRVSGVEPSSAAARSARDTLGLTVSERTAEDLPPEDARYDAVAVLQTLEHISDPLALLDWVHRALRPGGLLLVTVPDIGSRTSRLMGRWWPSYRPEHLWYFDRRTLPRLLGRAGFRTLSARPDDPIAAPLPRIIERLGHYLGLRLGRAAGWLPKGLRVPVWLGDLELIARRMDQPRDER